MKTAPARVQVLTSRPRARHEHATMRFALRFRSAYSRAMNAEGEPFDHWRMWLGAIQQDVQRMHFGRTIWRRLVGIVNENEELRAHATFPQWITTNYAAAQSLAIRRQTDKRTDSISLRRLLMELEAQPEVVTRDRFVRVNCGGSERIAADLWPPLADPSGVHLGPAVVRADLDELLTTAATVERFASKRLAHWDVDEWMTPVTYGELHDCVDAVGKLLERYSGLLTGTTQGADPIMPVGWDRVFWRQWEERPPALSRS